MPLSGQVAIVTGGSRGIGRAIVYELARQGARVLVNYQSNAAAAEAVVAQVVANGGCAFAHAANVADQTAVAGMVDACLARWGQLDMLVNNAAVVHSASFLDLKEEDFDRVLRVNLKGSFLAGQAVARYLVEKVKKGGTPGSIVNMSSINAEVAIATEVSCSISKGGIGQLTKVMALALAPYGIRVNAIGRGSVMTDMLTATNADDEARRRLLSRTPLGRIGQPSEIAEIAAFLASDRSSYITGQTIFADGGRLALNYTVPVDPDA